MILLLNSLTIFTLRNYLGRMYTNENDVLLLVSKLLEIASITTFFDGIQTILGGVLRGSGNLYLYFYL